MTFAGHAGSTSIATHQRVDGAARIVFRAGDTQARLADLHQRAPCRVLFPHVPQGDLPQAVLLTTSGGLTDGDRVSIDAQVGAGARATFATQAAEKIYRAAAPTDHAGVRVGLRVEDGAYAEWFAQETIVFDGARLRREFTADIAADATLLAVESLVFGRHAMGETLRSGLVHDAWRVRRGGRLVFADALHLEGDDLDAQLTQPFGFDGAAAIGTVVYAAAQAPAQLAGLRELLDTLPCNARATALAGLVLVRCLAARAAALRTALIAVCAHLRHVAHGLPARLPQVWYC